MILRTVDENGNVAFRYAEGGGASSEAFEYPRAFDIKSLSKTQIELKNLWLVRGPTTILAEGTKTLALSGTLRYVAAKVNTVSHAITLEATENPATAFDVAPPNDTVYVKLPLYKLERNSISAGWSVKSDYRSALDLRLYV